MRRRLVGVADISISQSQQTAVVTFRPGTQVLSASAFREAVAEADVECSLEADVCGVIDGENVLRSSANVEAPLLQLRGGNAGVGRTVCVNGRLNERAQPYQLNVITVQPRG